MEIQASFDVLSAVIDGYESRGLPVETVDATTDDAGVSATVEVVVSLADLLAADDGGDGAFAAETVAVTEAGDLRVDLPAGDRLCRPALDAGADSASVDAARVTADGVVVTVALVVDPSATEAEPDGPVDTVADGSGETAHRSATGLEETDSGPAPDDDATDAARALARVRDESVPPFEDVAYLRRLYERCDTFAAMTRLFETDVSAETVRRYMIEAGVHDPNSYETDGADEASTENPSGEADPTAEDLPVEDVDVPADLTVGAVSEAVVDARTIYEVSRRLGLEQERTRDLLRRLDLLDLVTARIDAAPDRRGSPEEVAARIRQCAPGDAYPADG